MPKSAATSTRNPDVAAVAHLRGGHVTAATIGGFDFQVDYAWASAMGSQREHNEDTLLCDAALGLFAVADGMGGHAAGEVASRTAVAAVRAELRASETRATIRRYATEPSLERRRAVFAVLIEAVQAANRAVLRLATTQPEWEGMGTTLDLVLLVRDRAFFAHVGDARAYLVRPTTTLQLTHDHAKYDSLRMTGKRAPARVMARSPLSNSIGQGEQLAVDTLFVDLAQGHRIVLCSDGVFDTVDDENELTTTFAASPPEQVAQDAVAHARATGSRDDASCVVVCVGERMCQRGDDNAPRTLALEELSRSPLLLDMSVAQVMSTIAAGVEVDLPNGSEIPRAVANDRVAYLVLDGLVELPNGRTLGASALLMAESLLDIPGRGALPKVVEHARLLRIRHHDFNEVCEHSPLLAVELYKRIARHLATRG